MRWSAMRSAASAASSRQKRRSWPPKTPSASGRSSSSLVSRKRIAAGDSTARAGTSSMARCAIGSSLTPSAFASRSLGRGITPRSVTVAGSETRSGAASGARSSPASRPAETSMPRRRDASSANGWTLAGEPLEGAPGVEETAATLSSVARSAAAVVAVPAASVACAAASVVSSVPCAAATLSRMARLGAAAPASSAQRWSRSRVQTAWRTIMLRNFGGTAARQAGSRKMRSRRARLARSVRSAWHASDCAGT